MGRKIFVPAVMFVFELLVSQCSFLRFRELIFNFSRGQNACMHDIDKSDLQEKREKSSLNHLVREEESHSWRQSQCFDRGRGGGRVGEIWPPRTSPG